MTSLIWKAAKKLITIVLEVDENNIEDLEEFCAKRYDILLKNSYNDYTTLRNKGDITALC